MEEKYKNAFVESLSLNDKTNIEKLEYNQIPEWDSIGHMTLIADLEEKFDISFDTDDIVNFSSYKKGKEILKKLGINF